MKTQLLILAATFGLGLGTPVAHALTADESAKVLESYPLEKQGDLNGAIHKMTTVLSSNSKDYFVNIRLAWLYSVAKKYKNAIDHYETAASVAPHSIEPLLGLSLLQTNLGSFAAAKTASEQVLERDPHNYLGFSRLIGAQIKLKDFAGAAAKAEAAIRLYPADPVFLEQRGYAQMQQGKVAEAKRTLHQLLLASPNNVYAQMVLGDALAH